MNILIMGKLLFSVTKFTLASLPLFTAAVIIIFSLIT
jgi:hypothetical protein